MKNKDLLPCELGVHRFDKKMTENRFLCSICERVSHFKDSDGYESWSEYDKNGNEIHYRNSIGYESWYEYDKKGNMIHYKNSYGYSF